MLALIYTRVSSDEQKRSGLSLDAQLSACRRYAAERGWVIGDEYTDVLSGTRDDRPHYVRLLGDVRRLRAERRELAVVVMRLDRLGRRVLERVRSREELKSLGVATHSVSEGEVSDLLANILASVAQEEVERLGQRVSEVRRHVVSLGWAAPGRTSWGYRWRPATDAERAQGAPQSVLEVDPASSPFLVEAFARVAGGETVRSVARWAATLPAAARGGGLLTYGSVRDGLHNPIYVGRAPARGPFKNWDPLAGPIQRWPALVDEALWRRVQEQIARHHRIPRQASGQYLLTGLIKCPKDGRRMNGCPARPEQRQPERYRCSGHINGACHTVVTTDKLDATVLAEVERLINGATDDAEFRAALRKAWAKLSAPAVTSEAATCIMALEREADKARQRLTNAAVLLVDGTIDKAGYELLRDKAQADLDAAERERATLSDVPTAPALPSLDVVLRDLGGWADALTGTDAVARREVLGALVDRVVPERVGWGRYLAKVTWTPLAAALWAATGTGAPEAA